MRHAAHTQQAKTEGEEASLLKPMDFTAKSKRPKSGIFQVVSPLRSETKDIIAPRTLPKARKVGSELHIADPEAKWAESLGLNPGGMPKGFLALMDDGQVGPSTTPAPAAAAKLSQSESWFEGRNLAGEVGGGMPQGFLSAMEDIGAVPRGKSFLEASDPKPKEKKHNVQIELPSKGRERIKTFGSFDMKEKPSKEKDKSSRARAASKPELGDPRRARHVDSKGKKKFEKFGMNTKQYKSHLKTKSTKIADLSKQIRFLHPAVTIDAEFRFMGIDPCQFVSVITTPNFMEAIDMFCERRQPSFVVCSPCGYVTSSAWSPHQAIHRAFLLTFRTFMTAETLADCIIQRYLDSEDCEATKSLILQFLKLWLEHYYHIFDRNNPEVEGKLKSFVENHLSHGTGNCFVFMMERTDASIVIPPKAPIPATIPMIPDHHITFDDLHIEELAKQITLHQQRLFQAIQPQEFFAYLHPQERAKHAPNLVHFVETCNKVSGFVQRRIITQAQLDRRVKGVTWAITLLLELEKLNNMAGAMDIVGALSMTPIQRLANTWSNVDEGLLKLFRALQDRMCFSSNFKAMRQFMDLCEPPLVPYIGMYLTDLTFILDGNPDKCPDGGLNFNKRKMMADTVHRLMDFQQVCYQFEAIESIQRKLVSDLPELLGDDESYKQSLRVEPRNASEALEDMLVEEDRLREENKNLSIRVAQLEKALSDAMESTMNTVPEDPKDMVTAYTQTPTARLLRRGSF